MVRIKRPRWFMYQKKLDTCPTGPEGRFGMQNSQAILPGSFGRRLGFSTTVDLGG